METSAKRRSFLQSIFCFIGGTAAIHPQASADSQLILDNPHPPASLRLQIRAKRSHRTAHDSARHVCRAELLRVGEEAPVGEFYANCFCSESSFGIANPFAGSHIELHTIRLNDGTLFGVGANTVKSEREKTHAILGGTGRFAGARGTYVISESKSNAELADLTISLIS